MRLFAKRKVLSRTFLGALLALAGLFLFAPLVHASTTITTCTQLQNIGATSTEPSSGSYILGNTIDCSASATWNPISGGGYFGFFPLASFTGTLNGNGNTITGLYENEATSSYIGLFSTIGSGGTVENLTIASSTIIGVSDVGVLAGQSNSGIVQNVTVGSGSVTGSSTAEFIGGLIGNNTGAVSTSSAAVTVNGTSYVGGLIGENAAVISGSWATGNVSSTVGGGEYIGGLIGNSATGGTVTNSYSTGTVIASGDDDESIGGLVGYGAASVSNSYSTSPVTANGYETEEIGGLIGYNEAGNLASTSATGLITATGHQSEYIGGLVGDSYGAINNSYSTGNVVGTSTSEYVGGFDGELAGGSATQCYETGNVTGGYYSLGGFTAGSYGTISESFSTGNVYVEGYSGYYDYYIGGFDGFSEDPLNNDYETGNVVIDSSVPGADLYYTGGFDGYSEAAITNSYASGSIVGSGSYPYLGGFVGYNAAPVLNSYFAGGGTAFLLSTTTGTTGYFIGETSVNTLTNDAQFYNRTPAIGDDTTVSGSDALLATHSYGTDEHTLLNFYSTTEPVYAQATTTAWDFTSIWETHPSSFPTFQWFSPPTPAYTITASAGTGGIINDAGIFSVLGGANQTYNIIPNSGYTIANVLVDGVSVGTVSTYTFSNVSANHTIAVTFTAPVQVASSGGGSSGGGTVQNRVTNLITNGNTPAATALMQEYPSLFSTSSTGTGLLSSASVSASTTLASSVSTFTRSLTVGSIGADVKALQHYLNTHGFTVAATGSGSLGNETMYFGKATRTALIKFQKANGITPSVGYFGPLTRSYLMTHF